MKCLLNNECMNEWVCIQKDGLSLHSSSSALALFHQLISLEILAESFSMTQKWAREGVCVMASGALCPAFVSDSQIWEEYACSLSPHSSPSKLFLRTCSWPAGKGPMRSPRWVLSFQHPKSQTVAEVSLESFLPYTGCQNQPYRSGKEMKGRRVGGLPDH